MSPRTLSARERQRLDALIDGSLRAFRTDIAAMSVAELARLRSRLETRLVGARFAQGGHGLARHQAAQEIPLLERRLAITQDRAHSVAAPAAAVPARPAQLRLLEPVSHRDTLDMEERAAA
ncbi:MAG: hypothetical protein QM692_04345 [Thermomicrobiales bacterium]